MHRHHTAHGYRYLQCGAEKSGRSVRRAWAAMQGSVRRHGQQTLLCRLPSCWSAVRKYHLPPQSSAFNVFGLDAGWMLIG